MVELSYLVIFIIHLSLFVFVLCVDAARARCRSEQRRVVTGRGGRRSCQSPLLTGALFQYQVPTVISWPETVSMYPLTLAVADCCDILPPTQHTARGPRWKPGASSYTLTRLFLNTRRRVSLLTTCNRLPSRRDVGIVAV